MIQFIRDLCTLFSDTAVMRIPDLGPSYKEALKDITLEAVNPFLYRVSYMVYEVPCWFDVEIGSWWRTAIWERP